MQRKYNPFKMWGSYVGLAIGLVIGFLTYSTILVLCEFGGPCRLTAFIIPFIPIGLGFLVGWGIHSLFRRLLRNS